MWCFVARHELDLGECAKTQIQASNQIFASRPKKWGRLLSGVFGGQPRGRKVDQTSETDAIRACHSDELTAREERHALAIVHSLTTNPYGS